MKPQNEEFRHFAQAFQDDFPHEGKEQACPKAEVLWNAVAGQFSPQETLKWVNHTATCPACAEHWRIARQLQQSESFLAESDKPVRRNRSYLAFLPLAAVAVIALSLVIMNRPSPVEIEDPTLRSAPVPTIASTLEKGQTLSRESCVLSWRLSVNDNAVTYRLRVTTADPFDVVTEAKVSEARYQIPTTELERLPPKTPLLWRVSAILGDQSEVHSPTFTHLLP